MPVEPPGPEKLAEFRSYLVWLARVGLDPRLRSKFDSSDVAQQTLTQAMQKWHQFRGRTEAELKGWLQKGRTAGALDPGAEGASRKSRGGG